MAASVTTHEDEDSPSEDFDPLNDDNHDTFPAQDSDGELGQLHRIYSHGASGGSSLDTDEVPMDYGVTPPSTRDKKKKGRWRVKRQHNIKVEMEEEKAVKRRQHRAAVVQAQLDMDQYNADTDFQPDPSADGPKSHLVMRRKLGSRKNSKSREQARAYKAQGNFDNMPYTQMSVEVDCSNKYHSVYSKRIHHSDIPGVHRKPKPANSLPASKYCTGTLQNCPVERCKFYDELVTSFKIRCNRDESLHKDDNLYQSSLKDLIWLELKAWHHDINLVEQDQLLFERRTDVDKVLNDILMFKAKIPDTVDHVAEGDTCTGKKYSGFCVYNTVRQQKAVVDQVSLLLERLEYVEELYPTTKSLGEVNHLYKSKEFQDKISSINAWLNITRDLNHKLKLMSKVLYLDKIDDQCWPSLDDFGSEKDNSDKQSPATTSPDAPESASSLSRIFSHMSIEELSHCSMYRYYVERTLKKIGLRKLLVRLKDLLHGSLSRARDLLQLPDTISHTSTDSSPSSDLPTTKYLVYLAAYLEQELPVTDVDPFLMQFHQQIFVDMKLPSFRSTYMLLVRIPLGVVHECLRMRLEQKPEKEPSLLSVRQLMRQCKEVLMGAIVGKEYYREMVCPILQSASDYTEMEQDLESLEEDMEAMLDLYLNYLQTWMLELQHLPEMSKRLKNALEEEWSFTKSVSHHIREGEAKAGSHFCRLASHMFRSISDYLDSGTDDYFSELDDTTLCDSVEEDEDSTDQDCNYQDGIKQMLSITCRNIKKLFRESRERASKALGFAKLLHKDLEMAAAFRISSSVEDLLDRLQATDHVMIKAPQSAGYMMFVPSDVALDKGQILQLLNMTCGREDLSSFNTEHASYGGYLLVVKCDNSQGDIVLGDRWQGPSADVAPTAGTTIALSYMQVESVLLVVTKFSQLGKQRKQFEQLMGTVVTLVNEHTSCHQVIADSLDELKHASLYLQEKITLTLQQLDDKLSRSENIDSESDKTYLQKLTRQTLSQCFNFGFEYNKELIRLVSGSKRLLMASNLVTFAQFWMNFVITKCERGNGCIHRWATHGIEFIQTACEPRMLMILTEEQFQSLKLSAMACVEHLIGNGTCDIDGKSSRSDSPFREYRGRQGSAVHSVSCPECQQLLSPSLSPHKRPFSSSSTPDVGQGAGRLSCPHSAGVSDDDDGGLFLTVQDGLSPEEERCWSRMDQVNKALDQVEEKRQRMLRNNRAIGRVCTLKQGYDYRITIRRVHFKWQRGIKIGEGSFGKVYTAVNMDTGELMAMKEVIFQPNDHQRIKEIADEIKNCEGISDPLLIKYYGVELHRDEMLIFMEYCAGGTIAEVSKDGLTEAMIRRFTLYICRAVSILHEHGIAHRDIKGANIFLTEDGLKLGDFGSSVKLKESTTMKTCLAGRTIAYCAPEVIRNEAHGMAADIWSLGCVVIEMASGKRPWYELQDPQIMYKVGMDNCPAIPDSLSEEGRRFVNNCLNCNPSLRWTAIQLLEDPFVNVDHDDE